MIRSFVFVDALYDMVNQFAYRHSPEEGKINLGTGGLSALEKAFEVLGLPDPVSLEVFNSLWEHERE